MEVKYALGSKDELENWDYHVDYCDCIVYLAQYINYDSTRAIVYGSYIIDDEEFTTRFDDSHGKMFAYCHKLEKIDVCESVETDNLLSTEMMFYGCRSLKELDLSFLDTSKVVTMKAMLAECDSLTKVNVSSFHTHNVERMSAMFYNCRQLKKLNLANFTGDNLEYASGMFFGCARLEELIISSLNTPNLEAADKMFKGCSSLKEILFPMDFITSSVFTMEDMFYGCLSLKELDLSMFEIGKDTDVDDMFTNCPQLTSIKVTSKNVKRILNTFDDEHPVGNTTVTINL